VWQAPLAVHSTKRRHQSPEWTILSHSYHVIQREIVRPQILLDLGKGQKSQPQDKHIVICLHELSGLLTTSSYIIPFISDPTGILWQCTDLRIK